MRNIFWRFLQVQFLPAFIYAHTNNLSIQNHWQ